MLASAAPSPNIFGDIKGAFDKVTGTIVDTAKVVYKHTPLGKATDFIEKHIENSGKKDTPGYHFVPKYPSMTH